MDTSDLTSKSKKLSWLLRHGARESNLEMDSAGWARVSDVLRLTHLSLDQLLQVVEENNKSRLQIDGDKIRACQGHSLSGTPVTREALEASWTRFSGDEIIWHGTSVDAAMSIAKSGISSVERTHVHLADSLDATVGKRAGVALMLGISPAKLRSMGLEIYVSQNGVVLAREVPAACIVEIEGFTKAGKSALTKVREAFQIVG